MWRCAIALAAAAAVAPVPSAAGHGVEIPVAVPSATCSLPPSWLFAGVRTGMDFVPTEYRGGLDWAYVAGSANNYVIGNCYAGWSLGGHMSYTDAEGRLWYGGYIGGDFSGCGWTLASWMAFRASGGHVAGAGCATPSRPFSSYAVLYNRWPCCDGAYVDNPVPCPVYANVRPWSPNAMPTDFLRVVPAHAVYTGYPRLQWRYTTRYGDMVMTRDRAVPPGAGNWAFVPRSCLPSTLPRAIPVPP
jgi:hypothetical protein